MISRWPAIALAVLVGLGCHAAFAANGKVPITIEDCIRLVRIEQRPHLDDRMIVVSRDGARFAVSLWSGDLAEDKNRYRIVMFDAAAKAPPRTLLTIDYVPDPHDQHAGPVQKMTFVAGHRELALLATLRGEPRQVYLLNVETQDLRPLTRTQHGVEAFDISADGRRLIVAVHVPAAPERRERLRSEGFSVAALLDARAFGQIAAGDWTDPAIQFELIDTSTGNSTRLTEPIPVDPSVGGRGRVWLSPGGRHAVVYPHMTPDGARTFGLLDIGSMSWSSIADGSQARRVLWIGDAHLLFISGPDAAEYSLATKESVPLPLGGGWEPLDWSESSKRLVLLRRRTPFADATPDAAPLATLERHGRRWGRVVPIARRGFDLNLRYAPAAGAGQLVGVRDSLTTAPEIAVFDFAMRRTRVLSDLNPWLRERSQADVTPISWSGPFDRGTSFGYLVRPLDYEPGKRYPLIIQVKDVKYAPDDRSFILDGQGQLSGAAIQPWAAAGFVVLFTPFPKSMAEVYVTPEEPRRFLAHIESGIDELDRQGLIDPGRVAITGWSRAGYLTQYVIARSSRRFKAASQIDNIQYSLTEYALAPTPIAWEYYRRNTGNLAPWGETAQRWFEQSTDFALNRITTPFLLQAHGSSLLYQAETYAALETRQVPVDLYFFPGAPHSVKSPRHRLTSLSVHTDWFRFWLNGEEDADPAKAEQYARWRALRR